ncbi:hypothetical protein [Massilia antarctica]|uniref:hypothetical protein n=1 Tax=Massilia antarctica TaxID=2765360 RepID=UPI0006BC5FE7|nr:hypothetical protein [Massilia sp. H27-R4]MCY0912933.1 hypothetical protein [Massilia sp. H27-R4]CUI07509.1 hypothetical protein BN2497_9795 [Janthinobacterium sp. CG23_2]CUU31295.1 hypothetical protein BN3177_9795 [Janthinobacterium sp. CG23_2]
MNAIPLFSWLYDVELCDTGIRFKLLQFLTVHILEFENIKSVDEIGQASPGSPSAYNFKNRIFARSFLIQTQHGWFVRKILVTPKIPNEFVVWLNEHGLAVEKK